MGRNHTQESHSLLRSGRIDMGFWPTSSEFEAATSADTMGR